MLRENKNLKDTSRDSIKDISSLPTSYEAPNLYIGSYTKTDKLVTALYMVTDIIDQDEPLRNKLRTLGIEILSDIFTISMSKTVFDIAPENLTRKIQEVMSFLDLASTINVISEMNCNILRKEFTGLYQSIKESTGQTKSLNRQINLSEFFAEAELSTPKQSFSKGHYQPLPVRQAGIGHSVSNSLGVQKGSTLLKALSNRKLSEVGRPNDVIDILKKQRRDDIIKALQKRGGNATITDIKNEASGVLVSCGEKTLQRELVSMVKGGVLYKTGEKRWSRYFLK